MTVDERRGGGMTRIEAKIYMQQGGKVTKASWDKSSYLYFDESKRMMFHDSTGSIPAFGALVYFGDDWLAWEAETEETKM